MSQIEFDFTRKPAEIVPFPAARMREAVREAAKEVRHHDGDNRWWHHRQAADRFVFGPMTEAGIPRDEIERQEAEFEKAIEEEAARLDVIEYLFGDSDEAGGAA